MPWRSVAVDDGAARAGALHVEVDDTVLEAAEGDVAASRSRPAGRTRVSMSSLMVVTVSESSGAKNSSASAALRPCRA